MAKKKQFKAESKRLLDLMIHSIYTNKDIFLRELLSNASDANDKLYFKSLDNPELDIDRQNLTITLKVDPEARTLSISDTGIGMSKEGLENYLGVIANSGSFSFKEEMDDASVIGQFGVGFYSAFMVSKEVEVISKTYDSDTAYAFISSGIEGYEIKEATKETRGTEVILHLRDNTEDEDYDKFLKPYVVKELVKMYSDYIRYPILLEDETLNSMIPIWKRSKMDVTSEELNTFYKDKFHDYEDPHEIIQMQIEGNPSFDALLFIPSHIPVNFYSAQYEVGVELYSRGVFIMEHNKALVPDYFRFIRGLVDSPDLPLNISREILQNDRQLINISTKIKKKIKAELEKMMKDNRDKYETFWHNFGISIKYGVYSEFGANKDFLLPLVLIKSSHDLAYSTLSEYVKRMKKDQEYIYYVSADTLEKCQSLPQTQYVLSKGYEVLYLTDEIDEFMIQLIHQFEEKSFKNISQNELDLSSETEKEEISKIQEDSRDVLESIKEALAGKVDDVRLSTRLIEDPVCLVSEDGLSIEMEKVLQAMPDSDASLKAKRVLEINPHHQLLKSLGKASQTMLTDAAYVLYNQACLIEGLPLEDPIEFSKKLASLMIKAL